MLRTDLREEVTNKCFTCLLLSAEQGQNPHYLQPKIRFRSLNSERDTHVLKLQNRCSSRLIEFPVCSYYERASAASGASSFAFKGKI